MHLVSALRNYFGHPKKAHLGLLLLVAILVCAAALFSFGWLVEEVWEGDANRFDGFARTAMHSFASPALTRIMQSLSLLGSIAFTAVLTILSVSLFLYFRLRRAAAFVLVIMTGAAILDLTLKQAFHRPRPTPYFGVAPSSYSFPSGHALGAVCFYGALAIILSATANRTVRIGVWTIAILLILGIGLSRIYLGVHYPSDVVAGYTAAFAWIGTVFVIGQVFDAPPAKGPEPSSVPPV